MGTRGAYGFRQGNRDMVWGHHYDSYPDGLGVSILNELNQYFKKKTVKKLRDKLVKIDVADNVQFQYGPSLVIRGNTMWKPYNDTTMMEEGSVEPFLYGAMRKVVNYSSFLTESLFCEWAYIVNLDSEMFEVWRGFQEKSFQNNRYGCSVSSEVLKTKYYPCKMVIEYDLKKLPSASKMEKDCYKITNGE